MAHDIQYAKPSVCNNSFCLLSDSTRAAQRFRACGNTAASIARILHLSEFAVANLCCRGPAEFIVQLFTCWFTEVAGILGGCTAILTCISHEKPPFARVARHTRFVIQVSRQAAGRLYDNEITVSCLRLLAS